MKTEIKRPETEETVNHNTKPLSLLNPLKLVRIKLFITIAFILLNFITSCTGPGEMIDIGYLVSIKENNKTQIYRVSDLTEVEQTILESTHIELKPFSLIGKKDPFFEFRNSEVFIYIEKKGIYEKRGKERWRIYDRKLANTK